MFSGSFSITFFYVLYCVKYEASNVKRYSTLCKILMFHILILNNCRNIWLISMGFVANKKLKTEYLFHIKNFDIILISTPSQPFTLDYQNQTFLKRAHGVVQGFLSNFPESILGIGLQFFDVIGLIKDVGYTSMISRG